MRLDIWQTIYINEAKYNNANGYMKSRKSKVIIDLEKHSNPFTCAPAGDYSPGHYARQNKLAHKIKIYVTIRDNNSAGSPGNLWAAFKVNGKWTSSAYVTGRPRPRTTYGKTISLSGCPTHFAWWMSHSTYYDV